jgi:hypothetical protein
VTWKAAGSTDSGTVIAKMRLVGAEERRSGNPLWGAIGLAKRTLNARHIDSIAAQRAITSQPWMGAFMAGAPWSL